MITEIPDSTEPYTDSFGRVTYFYIKLGKEALPIYQPGCIMFETGVKADSEVAVEHGGS